MSQQGAAAPPPLESATGHSTAQKRRAETIAELVQKR